MKYKKLVILALCVLLTAGCAAGGTETASAGAGTTEMEAGQNAYSYTEHPEQLRKLVLYAPILSGVGEAETTEPFSHNDWAGAAEDFQTREDGSFDPEVTDPVVIEMFCSSCWHYDGDSSPNGWRKDALVSKDTVLIDLEKITVPTLVICGDKDPYMDWEAVNASPELLPEGSELKVIPGGSHILLYEKNCYKEFQDEVVRFLMEE